MFPTKIRTYRKRAGPRRCVGPFRRGPGYSSRTYADETGSRSLTVSATTTYGLHDAALGALSDELADAAVCVMNGKPIG